MARHRAAGTQRVVDAARAAGAASVAGAERVASAERNIRRSGRVTLIAAIAAIGGFLFGFDTAVINGAVGAIRGEFGIGAGPLGLAVASALLGSAVGAWFGGALSDRIGRLRVMQIAGLLFLVSAILTGVAGNIVTFSIWRVVGGIGVGAASVIVPAYIAEVAPASHRGRLGSLQQLAIVVGIFIALLSDYAIAEISGGASADFLFATPAWRWMFWVGAIPAVVYLFGTLVIPESPRYLVARGQIAEAERVLREVGSEDAPAKIAEIQATLEGERKPSLRDVRGNALGLLPIVWVGIGLSVLQQFVGINVIFYYSTELWSSVGFSESSAMLTSVITAVTNIVVTLVALSIIDKVGRKPLLLVGSSGMIASLGALALIFGTAGKDAQGAPDLGDVAGIVALVAANLFVVSFAVSWGPAVWVLLGEMFPNRIRAMGLAIAGAAQWLANWAVSTTFPSLKDTSLAIPYGIYTFFAVVSLVFVLKCVRETKGKELEDM